jgi:hypothetical protein
MFNSAVLDLATGLIFCFLTVSLATGTIVEMIASILTLRARTLRKGIGQLLNDPTYRALAKDIYAHAAINPRSDGTDASISAANRKNPAYIDRQLFGQAMLDILKISPEVANAVNNPSAPLGKPTVGGLKTAVGGALADAAKAQGKAAPDDQLEKFLHGVIERSLGNPDKIKEELVAWFDNGMDRVSGVYKRWTQLIGFLVALVLAAALNIDSIGVAKTLWLQPTLAEKLTADKELKADQAFNKLNAAIPIGWPNGLGQKVASPQAQEVSGSKQDIKLETFKGPDWGLAFLGWLITALATLFGAPFWFDLLQTVIRLKGSGPSPKEKVDGKGASA